MKYLTVILATIVLTGCVSEDKIAVSKEVLQNRKLYAKEIVAATNECIKAYTSLTHLIAAGNDQEEAQFEREELLLQEQWLMNDLQNEIFIDKGGS